tara:strand:+ start:1582 stop:1779 length:198 start_codon:yes stop_codon:yes gene_type:complete
MTFKLYITPVPLSFLITPNKALGVGVILTVLQTFSDGDQMIVEEIPHHNRASAEFTKRQIIAANR